MIAIINLREYRRAIKNGQSIETNKIGYICVGHHYAQSNTDNINKTNNWQ
jgi:hypothetical protein